MSRFNTATVATPSAKGGRKTTNLSGGVAYTQDAKTEFASLLLTNFATDQYHRSLDDTIARLRQLITQVDPKFAAKAAIFARDEFGMRSITHIAAGEIAMAVKGEEWTKSFFDKIVVRPDDIMETLAYIQSVQGSLHPVPNSLKKGFGAALARQSEYTLGRYQGKRRGIKMRDVVNLVRPPATVALTKLMNGDLKFEGWETAQTQAGQKATTDDEKVELKAEAWGEFVKSPNYFALLRNLRNIRDKAPQHLDAALKALINPAAIHKSRVLPFRYLTAMDQFMDYGYGASQTSLDRKIIQALNKAMEIALDNVPELPGEWLVVTDLSGSMTGGWAATGPNTTPAKIASLFTAAVARKNGHADVMGFGSTAVYKAFNPSDSMDTLRQRFEANDGVGHGTNFQSIFSLAASKKKKSYDGIVIFSDMQANLGYGGIGLNKYKSVTGADPQVFAFDLGGHGTSQFSPAQKHYQIAGFSEKVFDLMKQITQDPHALVSRIEAIEL